MPGARPAVDMATVFDLVATDRVTRYPGGAPTLLLIDVGAKDNIVRSLIARGATVVRAGWRAELEALAAEADDIVIGNGPGDPRDLAAFSDRL